MFTFHAFVGAGLPSPIGVNLAVFDSVLATMDINMPPLQG